MIKQITISGVIEIDDFINKDTEYSIILERIQQKEGKFRQRIDANDEEVITYQMESLGKVSLVAEGKVIAGKSKKGSMAQALRSELNKLWEEQFSGEGDFETFYNKTMLDHIAIIKEHRNIC